MKFGYECVKPMCDELLAFMEKHKFETLADFKGKSLDYFTTHAELVRMQARTQSSAKSCRRRSGSEENGASRWRMERRRFRETIRRARTTARNE